MENVSHINGALGQRITELCVTNNLTMTELAQRSSVSPTTLQRIKRGERVSPGTLGRVSAAIAGAALLAPSNGTLDDLDCSDDRLTTLEQQLVELELRLARIPEVLLRAMELLELELGAGKLDPEHGAA
jgi:transcriptional regulator with XRE-family HTH domain